MLLGRMLSIGSFYVQAVPGQIHVTPVLEVGWAFCTINCVLLTAGTFLMFTCIETEKCPRVITRNLETELRNVSHCISFGFMFG